MPTVIIHPTQTPDSYIKHDGPWARSWMGAPSKYAERADAKVTAPEEQKVDDTSGILASIVQASPHCVIVRNDEHGGAGERDHAGNIMH